MPATVEVASGTAVVYAGATYVSISTGISGTSVVSLMVAACYLVAASVKAYISIVVITSADLSVV